MSKFENCPQIFENVANKLLKFSKKFWKLAQNI
jgi:hypothetical protein